MNSEISKDDIVYLIIYITISSNIKKLDKE